jgi:hypothetical protein
VAETEIGPFVVEIGPLARTVKHDLFLTQSDRFVEVHIELTVGSKSDIWPRLSEVRHGQSTVLRFSWSSDVTWVKC